MNSVNRSIPWLFRRTQQAHEIENQRLLASYTDGPEFDPRHRSHRRAYRASMRTQQLCDRWWNRCRQEDRP